VDHLAPGMHPCVGAAGNYHANAPANQRLKRFFNKLLDAGDIGLASPPIVGGAVISEDHAHPNPRRGAGLPHGHGSQRIKDFRLRTHEYHYAQWLFISPNSVAGFTDQTCLSGIELAIL